MWGGAAGSAPLCHTGSFQTEGAKRPLPTSSSGWLGRKHSLSLLAWFAQQQYNETIGDIFDRPGHALTHDGKAELGILL